MNYFILGDEDSVLGFGMVGVEGKVIESPEEARDAFQFVLKDHSVGIVIMTEKVANMIRETVDRYLFSEQFPLILEIPNREGPLPGRPGLRDMVNEAIGIKL